MRVPRARCAIFWRIYAGSKRLPVPGEALTGMIRKILIGVLALAVAVSGTLTVSLAAFNADRFRPMIIRKASEALGTPVDLGRVSLGWRNGLAMRLQDVVVYADAGKGSVAAKLKEASAALQIVPLLRREIRISSLALFDPQAHLVRTADGKVGLKGAKPPFSAGAAEKTPASVLDAGVPAGPAAFSINLFQIRNGAVWFESVAVKNIDMDVKKFSLEDPFSFVARASLFSSRQNLQAEGMVTLPRAAKTGLLEKGVFKTDLSELDLDELGRTFPAARSSGIQELEGTLETKIDRLELGSGLPAKAALTLEDGRVRLASFTSPLDDLAFKGFLAGDDLKVENFSAKYAGGAFKAGGVVKQFGREPLSGFTLSARDLAIEQMIPPPVQPGGGAAPESGRRPRLSGRLSLDLEGQAAGKTGPQIARTMAGRGQLSLKDGVLLNHNLLRTVVQKLSAVPGADQMLRDNLPDIYKAKMNEPSTILQPIQVPFTVQNGQLVINRLDLVTDFVRLEGAGQVGLLDKGLSARSTVFVEPQLSQTIASLVPQVRVVLNARGEIELPVTIQGRLPHVTVIPDANYIAQKLLSSEAAQQVLRGFVENPEAGVRQVRNLLDKPVAAGESGVKNSVAGLLGSEDGLKNLFKQVLSGDLAQTTASDTGSQNQ